MRVAAGPVLLYCKYLVSCKEFDNIRTIEIILFVCVVCKVLWNIKRRTFRQVVELSEQHLNATRIKRCSAVFFAGRADWSPWETETVEEPAFGPYHFTGGGL